MPSSSPANAPGPAALPTRCSPSPLRDPRQSTEFASMKITILSSAPGSQPFTLADSPDPVPMVNFRMNGSRNVQEAQFFRATARSFYDRGNRKTEVTFDVTRVFADQVTAESFILMHET